MTSLIGNVKDLIRKWNPRRNGVPFSALYREFQNILDRNSRVLELMADLNDKMNGEYIFDRTYIHTSCKQLTDQVFNLISELRILGRETHLELFIAFDRIQREIQEELSGQQAIQGEVLTWSLEEMSRDTEDEVGAKNANLGEARNLLGLMTPDGFAITAKAYREFIKHNGLDEFISRRLSDIPENDDQALARTAREIHERIMSAKAPKALSKALRRACRRLAHQRRIKPQDLVLAVRSSALAEDYETSFAGQYKTILNVQPEGLFEAYREVVASAYHPSGLGYRLKRYPEQPQAIMAVGVQTLVEALVSGAVVSLDPTDPAMETMLVSATWGPGASLVEARQEPDHYRLTRWPPFQVMFSQIADKAVRLKISPGQAVTWSDNPPERRTIPCLDAAQLEQLAHAALQVERYFKRPQEIEWAFDREGRLIILQIRPSSKPLPPMDFDQIERASLGAQAIFSGKGMVAQRGVASGKVFLLQTEEDMERFPFGAILVTRSTSPRLARLMPRAQGIITDVGSPTGHMAAIAREFRVPTLVNTGVATGLLKDGQEVTLDAVHRVVYQGRIKELARFEMTEEDVFEDSQEYRLLQRVMKKITPLNLIDPEARNFTPSGCKTLHDISRYIHETAVGDIIDMSRSQRLSHGTFSRQLKTNLPLGLTIVDINGGCIVDVGPIMEPSDLCCIPLLDLLEGMEKSELWTTEPISVGFGTLLSSFTQTASANAAAVRGAGRNLAVISKEYLNLSLRLGYHYTMVDTYLSGNINDNYIFLRFLGGVADMRLRSRRARFVADVLERFDFRIEIHGDLVVGRLKKFPEDKMREKMRLLGALIAYARQLDARMDSDSRRDWYLQDFLEKINHLMEVQDEHHDQQHPVG